MPRYPFRCRRCDLEFDVSRSMRDAADAATCPVDGATAERIFEAPRANLNRPEPVTPKPRGSGYSHHGHSHGPGTGHHTH